PRSGDAECPDLRPLSLLVPLVEERRVRARRIGPGVDTDVELPELDGREVLPRRRNVVVEREAELADGALDLVPVQMTVVVPGKRERDVEADVRGHAGGHPADVAIAALLLDRGELDLTDTLRPEDLRTDRGAVRRAARDESVAAGNAHERARCLGP